MAEEKNLENRIRKFLKKEECWCLKYWAGGGFTRSGVPDLLICCNGYFVGAELKASRGVPTELQIRELLKIRGAGGIGILVDPDTEHTFRALILKLKMGVEFLYEATKLESNVFKWAEKYNIEWRGLS